MARRLAVHRRRRRLHDQARPGPEDREPVRLAGRVGEERRGRGRHDRALPPLDADAAAPRQPAAGADRRREEHRLDRDEADRHRPFQVRRVRPRRPPLDGEERHLLGRGHAAARPARLQERAGCAVPAGPAAGRLGADDRRHRPEGREAGAGLPERVRVHEQAREPLRDLPDQHEAGAVQRQARASGALLRLRPQVVPQELLVRLRPPERRAVREGDAVLPARRRRRLPVQPQEGGRAPRSRPASRSRTR